MPKPKSKHRPVLVERYGKAKEVKREGVGGHWRSHSQDVPPTALSPTLPPLSTPERQGRKRVMSEGHEGQTPLRAFDNAIIRTPVLAQTSADSLPGQPQASQELPVPALHVIHPSISMTPDDPSIYPPTSRTEPDAGQGDGSSKVGQDLERKTEAELEPNDAVYITPKKAGKSGRDRSASGGIISKIASHPSLSRLKISFASNNADQHHPLRAVSTRRHPSPAPSSSRRISIVEPSRRAPPPPNLAIPTSVKFAPSSSRVPSPSPTATPSQSRAQTPAQGPSPATSASASASITRAAIHPTATLATMNGQSPYRASVMGKEEGLIEIPRFKKRELNLGIVAGGKGQRAAWYMLWAAWLIWGLLSLFFDVNVLYMLVQCVSHLVLSRKRQVPFTANVPRCAQNPSTGPDSATAHTWIFAVAAYSVCWAISVFGVWLGWELWYEYWRRWRLPRPAIEPIHMSFPATLHLSLTSFPHFAFFVHVRRSALGTPHSNDILPETAHALLQCLPGLAPVLPRASMAVVLLVAFSSGDSTAAQRDPAFWTPSGELSIYARAALLAFASLTALRLLVVVISALILLTFSRPRARSAAFRSRFDSISSSPTQTRPTTPTRSIPRDPAETQSPSKGWVTESDLKWDWRERGRNRLQDAFELCMIRRYSRVSTPTPAPSSGLVVPFVGWESSLTRQSAVPLQQLVPWTLNEKGEQGRGGADGGQELLSPNAADPLSLAKPSASVIHFVPPDTTISESDNCTRTAPLNTAMARPESELESIRTPSLRPVPAPAFRPSSTSLDPRAAYGTLASARQSMSSQDLFYTPMSRSPATLPTRSNADMRDGTNARPHPSVSTLGPASQTAEQTPPSAYRRPSGPVPPGSSTGAPATTLSPKTLQRPDPLRGDSAITSASNKENIDPLPTHSMKAMKAQGVGEFGELRDGRKSTDTASAESISDDEAVLLPNSHSRHSSAGSWRTLTASQSSHGQGSGAQRASISHRASQILRERSTSLVSALRRRSVSLVAGQSAADSSPLGTRRDSYSLLGKASLSSLSPAPKDNGLGAKGDTDGSRKRGLVRGRSTSVGLLGVGDSGRVMKVRSGTLVV